MTEQGKILITLLFFYYFFLFVLFILLFYAIHCATSLNWIFFFSSNTKTWIRHSFYVKFIWLTGKGNFDHWVRQKWRVSGWELRWEKKAYTRHSAWRYSTCMLYTYSLLLTNAVSLGGDDSISTAIRLRYSPWRISGDGTPAVELVFNFFFNVFFFSLFLHPLLLFLPNSLSCRSSSRQEARNKFVLPINSAKLRGFLEILSERI